MMLGPRPIRPLVWLLRIVSSRDAAGAAIGDVMEELTHRVASDRGPRWPALWLNVQVARAIASAIRAGAPRVIRSVGLILRDATRAVRAAPAHASFVVLVLAVGVAAGTVTFSVVDAVLLKPLPFEQPEQLVTIPTQDQDRKRRISPEVYWRLREGLQSVELMAARTMSLGGNVTVGGVTEPLWLMRASADVFQLLRFSPAIGRFWTADDEARGDTDVAVLSYRFWREQFRGDTSVLGATITSGRSTYRVVGVLPEASDHPDLDLTSVPIWVPLVVPRAAPDTSFGIIARMRPGVSAAEVAADVQRLAGTPDWRPAVAPLLDAYVAPVRRWMLLALGAAALVVLIACVNAANLMLTRSTARAQEMAIRASLGGSRRQLAAAVLAEGLLLSFAATACALAFAIAGVRLARVAITTMLLGVFRGAEIALNGRVLVAALGTAVLAGVLVSLVPAWQRSRAPVATLLRDADAAATTGRRRWRGVFLVAEMASVVVLLVVSWLFVVSLIRVVGIDLGIDRANLLAVKPRTDFSGTVDEVQRRLEHLPGVSGVAVSRGASLPLVGRAFGGAWATTTVRTAGATSDAAGGSPIEVLDYRVTPNYFDVAGLPFLRGGTWAAETAFTSAPVVLDARAARQLFGDEEAIGGLIRATRPEGAYRVVGTVPHVYARGPEEADPPSAYFPLRPDPTRTFAGLFVKTSRPAEEMLSVVTEALKPVAPAFNEPYVFLAENAVRRITATRRFNGMVMSGFGLVGLLIGAAGVFAVMASFVAQQTREIGVRLALGATPARIQRGVLALAWRHVLAGLALGLPLAWWLSQGFAALLFQVTPADVSVYAGVAGLLTVVALVAAWIPARRAAGIDPIKSLRR